MRYLTAKLLHQEINSAIAVVENVDRLVGIFQVDDAKIGGERADDESARCLQIKAPFMAAVSLGYKDRPRLLKLSLVSGITSNATGELAMAPLAAGYAVIAVGLGCFPAVTTAGCSHRAVVACDRKPRDLPKFLCLNIVMGNPKTELGGGDHSRKYFMHST